MNTNEKQRCVMISADHGLAIVYFLQTDVVQTMLDAGIRVVVLTTKTIPDSLLYLQVFNIMVSDIL